MDQKMPSLFLPSLRNRLFFFVVSILLCGSALLFSVSGRKAKDSSLPERAVVGAQVYALEIADTENSREKGLGGRDALCETCGMLFVFEAQGQYAFWMRDMRFPIDIIWLLGERIVFVQHDVQPEFPDILSPTVFADRVLELGAGSGRYLRAGERIQFLYGE